MVHVETGNTARNLAVELPRDDGWHTILRAPGRLAGLANPDPRTMEWMYVNAHLTDADGNLFVVFAAYFTQGLRLLTLRRFDPEWRPLDAHQGTAVGLLRPTTGRLDLTFRHLHGRDTWRADAPDRSDADPGGAPLHASVLSATGPGFALELELRATRPAYPAGGTGHLPFAERGWFHYYSWTRLQVSGTITTGTTRTPVRGRAWIDHQWGPFFITPMRWPRWFEQYEWFSLQLSDGSDIVLTTVWTPDGHLVDRDAYGGAGWIRPDGTSTHLVGARRLQRVHFARDPQTGHVHAAGWRFVAPEWDCDLTLRPRTSAQIAGFAPRIPDGRRWAAARALVPLIDWAGGFWEGSCAVAGRIDGKTVEGDGFAELIKRYPTPVIQFAPAILRPPTVVVRWRASPCDPAAPLAHRVRVYDEEGRCIARADDLDVSVFCFAPGDARRCEVFVEAHTVDHGLRGEGRLTVAVDPRADDRGRP